MDGKKRSRRDFIQNITITFLSLLAVVLCVRTQTYGSGLSLSYFSSLGSGTSAVVAQEESVLSAPVRAAVSGSYGRYGSITLTTASERFAPLGSLLSEALSSARFYTDISEAALLEALDRPSVYCDFLGSLPLSVIGALMGGSGDDSLSARCLAVAAEEDGSVALYLWDDSGACLRCVTALSLQDLEDVIGQYEQGNAVFAFDMTESASAAAIRPLSLFLTEPVLPVLEGKAGTVSSGRLLSAMGFNPHTQTRWTEAGGTEVIVDGDRTLRLRSDGSFSYQSGGSSALSIASAGDTPTLQEAAAGVSAMLGKLMQGESCLYLTSISRSGDTVTLTYDYHHSGIPIRFADGSCGAKVTLSGNAVSAVYFTARQYTAADETALLLPLRQAMAVAAQVPDRELLICYADYGTERVEPQWLSE